MADFKHLTWSEQSGVAASAGAAGRCFRVPLFPLLFLLSGSVSHSSPFSYYPTYVLPFFPCASPSPNWTGVFGLCCFHCSKLFCICHFLSCRSRRVSCVLAQSFCEGCYSTVAFNTLSLWSISFYLLGLLSLFFCKCLRSKNYCSQNNLFCWSFFFWFSFTVHSWIHVILFSPTCYYHQGERKGLTVSKKIEIGSLEAQESTSWPFVTLTLNLRCINTITNRPNILVFHKTVK